MRDDDYETICCLQLFLYTGQHSLRALRKLERRHHTSGEDSLQNPKGAK